MGSYFLSHVVNTPLSRPSAPALRSLSFVSPAHPASTVRVQCGLTASNAAPSRCLIPTTRRHQQPASLSIASRPDIFSLVLTVFVTSFVFFQLRPQPSSLTDHNFASTHHFASDMTPPTSVFTRPAGPCDTSRTPVNIPTRQPTPTFRRPPTPGKLLHYYPLSTGVLCRLPHRS